jgi:glycosyltransferase involved in cell wall biosynthesis
MTESRSDRGAAVIALSVAIPCYDEAAGLSELYRRTTSACRAAVNGDYEIVLVNDGSNDETWEAICSLADRDPHVAGINLSRNHGHQLALTAALEFTCGERVLILDADLQDPPELLPKMMHLMDEGADVVYGQRRSRAGETPMKRATASLFYWILDKLTEIPIPRDTGDFRLVSRRVLDVLQGMPERHRFIRGMISWIGFRQVPLVYDRAPRFAGHTKYPFRRMLTFAFDAITSFSVRPLRMGLYLGLMMCFAACLLIVLTLVWWLVFAPLPGWTSLMVMFLLIGGVQTLLLGLIGEYLSRLYLQSKNRPLFIVRDLVNVHAVHAARAPEKSRAATV